MIRQDPPLSPTETHYLNALDSDIFRGRRTILTVLAVVILVMAFGLRIWRIDGPYDHTDELIARHVSHHLEVSGSWDNNWKLCEIPIFSGLDQYNFSAYLYATHLFRRAVAPMFPNQWQKEREGVVIHRLFSVICGTASVGMLMLIACRLAGPLMMLLAGALAAGNVQLVLDSHYARPETFMTMLVLVVIWLGLRPIERVWRPALMAFFVGLLAATKVTNLALLALPFFSAWQIRKNWNPKIAPVGSVAILISAMVSALILGAALGAPFAFRHPDKFLTGIRFLQAQYSGTHPPYSLPDHGQVWPIMRDYFVATHGLPLLVAMAVGAAFLARRWTWETGVMLLLPVLGYTLLFGQQRVFVERNLSPVLPIALLLGAVGFTALATWLWTNASAKIATTATMAVLLASITNAHALGLLLGRGVTEVEQERYQAFVAAVKKDFPKHRHAATSLYNDNEMKWLEGEVSIGRGELILTVVDFNDAYKVRGLPLMEKLFDVSPVAEYRGAFADYPLCGLNNFHGNRLRIYLVRSR